MPSPILASSFQLSASNCPRVSILMPVLNAAPYLAQAVQSVLEQTASVAWELLIVDDGSTDNTREIANAFVRRHPRCIRLLQHNGGANRGTSASRNLALAHARGEVIGFLDGDDVWLPHMLAHQLALLDRFPEADLVYANAERTWDMSLPCTPGAEPCGVNELPPLLPSGAMPGLLEAAYPLAWFLDDETTTPCTCTVLVRAGAAHAVGGFVESFAGLYDDQAFYAKVMLRGATAVSTECVARYRRHYTSCCARTWHDAALQTRARNAFRDWLQQYRQGLTVETDLLAVAD